MTFFLKQLLSLLVLITLILSPLSLKAADKSVSTFKNISPQSTSGSPTQTTGINQPTLSDRTIGALPAIKFNGSAQYLNYNGAPLAGKDYTIFVVEQRTAAVGAGGSYFFGTSAVTPAANVGLILGYKTDTQLVFSQGSNEEIIAIEPYSAGAKPVIHTFVQDSVNGKKYYRNGALVFSNGSNTTPLVSNNNAFIGLNETNKYYQGNIAEVAVYKRAISVDEISNIHGYLLDKWDITLTTDGTACLGTLSNATSPGHIPVTNGVWTDAANGATSSISCTVGGVIGTINDMLCTNGVWSGGDGGGVCGISDCTNDPNNTNPLIDGTWDDSSATNGQIINGTCGFGRAGAPTIQCVNGSYTNLTGSCVSSTDCGANSASYIDISGISGIAPWVFSGGTLPNYNASGTFSTSGLSCTSGNSINLFAINNRKMLCSNGSWGSFQTTQVQNAINGATQPICGATICNGSAPGSYTGGAWTYLNYTQASGVNPPRVMNGYLGMEIKFDCNPGLAPTGTPTQLANKVCQANGTWGSNATGATCT